MKNKTKKPYRSPEVTIFGSLENITQQGGGQGIDGVIGIDIDGDGNNDIDTGVTNGSM